MSLSTGAHVLITGGAGFIGKKLAVQSFNYGTKRG